MKPIFSFVLFLVLPMSLFAQSSLFIDNTVPVDVMIEDFFGTSCVTISNVSYSGDSLSKAYFEGANTNLDIPGGIFFSTGSAEEVSNSSNTFMSGTSGGTPDSTLVNIVNQNGGFSAFDGATITFELIPETSDTIYISYVFGSEEYPEFVCSQFNDLFGFFVSGPAPDGTIYNQKNVAMVPELDGSGYTDYVVAINSINGGENSQGGDPTACTGTNGSLDFSDYYVDNLDANNPDIAFDGMTVKLLAPLALVAGETYTITIAIADVADTAFDSGVFLGVESFCGDSLITPVSELTPVIDGQTVTFTGDSRYATAITIDFGNGEVVESLQPDTISYTYPVAAEYVLSITSTNYCCSDVDDFNIAVGVPSSVNNSALATKLTLAPNPVQSSLFVNWAGEEQELPYTIYDATGRKMLTGEAIMLNTRIDLTDLEKGLYFIRLTVGQEVVTKSFYKR